MHIELYEVFNDQGVSMSPFVWRARCALLYKGLVYESVPMGFADPREGFESFPTLRHDGELICGSWDIAEYLEERFIDRPRVFGNEQGKTLATFINHWVDNQLMPVVFRSIVVDIHDSARASDREFFRARKEQVLGDTLENSQQRQRAKGNRLTGLLEPARRLFGGEDFFGGNGPLYPDFCLFGMFQWARIASDYTLLEEDDPVRDWLGRMDAWLDRLETVQALRSHG